MKILTVGIGLLVLSCFIGGCGGGSSGSNNEANTAVSTPALAPVQAIPTTQILIIGSCWLKTTVADLSGDLLQNAIVTYGVTGPGCTFGTEGDIAFLKSVPAGEYKFVVFDSLTDIDLTHPNMMTTPDQYQQNLKEIISFIHALGAVPIFVNMPSMENDPSHPILSIQQYNALSLPIMQTQNVTEDDVYDLLLPYGTSVWIDPTDYYLLNDLGKQVVADSIKDTIQQASVN